MIQYKLDGDGNGVDGFSNCYDFFGMLIIQCLWVLANDEQENLDDENDVDDGDGHSDENEDHDDDHEGL